MRSFALALLVVLSLNLRCSVEPVELEGKTCPCDDGYVCVDGRCTRGGGPDGGPEGSVSECATVEVADEVHLSAGDRHTCAIREGQLYCWGSNATGQLGVGDTTQRATPTRVGAESDWRTVAASDGHTCGIRNQSGFGDLHCWGDNSHGQLGLGDLEARTVPETLSTNVSFRSVAVGQQHTCALTVEGTLWCWGRQEGGEVGLGNLGPPLPVPARVSEVDTYVHLGTGWGHNCTIRENATLWCWGQFGCMQLGSPNHQLTPHQVDDNCWHTTDAGALHTCGILADGTMRCFGSNERGQLGIGTVGGGEPGYEGCLGYPVPQPVEGSRQWATLAAGAMHTCGITTTGELWCWGYNEQRQVSASGEVDEPSPRRLGTANDWVEVATGFFHTCARNADGEVYCVGDNQAGQQGTGSANGSLTRVEF